MGHIRIPHDLAADLVPGVCPYHGDCLEGLASGSAIHARWGRARGNTCARSPGVATGGPLPRATAIANFAFTLSPERVILGGGVMGQQHLFAQKSERNWPNS